MEFDDVIIPRMTRAEARAHTHQIAHNPAVKKRLNLLKLINTAYMSFLLILGLVFIGVVAGILSENIWRCPGLIVIYVSTWIALFLGLVMFFIGAVGFCVVVRGYNHSTFKYITLIVSGLLIGFIVVLALSAKMDADFGNSDLKLKNSYSVQLASHFIEAKTQYAKLEKESSSDSIDCWNTYQTEFKCCGANAYTDWASTVSLGSAMTTNDNTLPLAISNTTGTNETTSMPLATSSPSRQVPSVPSDNLVTAEYLPSSCLCQNKSSVLPESIACSTIRVSKPTVRTAVVYSGGCIVRIKAIVSKHLLILMILSPVAIFLIAVFLVLTTILSLRVLKSSSIGDAYATAGGYSLRHASTRFP